MENSINTYPRFRICCVKGILQAHIWTNLIRCIITEFILFIYQKSLKPALKYNFRYKITFLDMERLFFSKTGLNAGILNISKEYKVNLAFFCFLS